MQFSVDLGLKIKMKNVFLPKSSQAKNNNKKKTKKKDKKKRQIMQTYHSKAMDLCVTSFVAFTTGRFVSSHSLLFVHLIFSALFSIVITSLGEEFVYFARINFWKLE